MNIKSFQWLITGVFLSFFVFINNISAAETYKEFSTPQATRTKDKIEVLEFFWYGCSYCYHLESAIEKWLEDKADYIEFIRVPGVFHKSWMANARAFYIAEKLGVLDKIHRPLFDAIHRDKRKLMGKINLRSFFEEQGVSGDDFDRAYQSSYVNDNIRYAISMGQRYGLKGVPAIIINGKYGTSSSMAGGYKEIFDVVNMLAEKEYEMMLKGKSF